MNALLQCGSCSSGMAAEVSSLTRYMSGRRTVGSETASEKSTAPITRDFFGGGSSPMIESSELDLDLHVPLGWEKRLDLKSGKVYIRRCGAADLSFDQKGHAEIQDLNSPPVCHSKLTLNFLDEPSLDLKLVSSSPPSSSPSSTLSLPFNYQSVCTLDKVKSALERAEREPTKRRSPFWRALQSPSTSSSSNKEITQEQEKDHEKFSDLSNSPVATGCSSCLAYVLVSEINPKCPRCNAIVPLPKKARLDLNMSI
ncbi:hypothetical protein SAY87_032016 [Trapa incisa]|uniref:GIR1-like zinc ribbon domain-containing protein n=1 Tax=Trapa incisa TaxID=236973 RepID=A0AAN7QLM2_9MYRT|nr:hypothetical protein SAY87_032016 [Trapa incisa]